VVGAPIADPPGVVLFQAIGMTMEYLDCSERDALLALLEAREAPQTLTDVAVEVVERRLRFDATTTRSEGSSPLVTADDQESHSPPFIIRRSGATS